MMDNFQNEIPKSRINLSVDLKVDGKTKTVALPHKTLVMGDFSAGGNCLPLQDRERKEVSKESLDAVIKDIAPTLNMILPNKIGRESEEIAVQLVFESLKDFHPESIVLQVPALKRLLAIRNLLKDLRAHMLDNQAFKEMLKNILQSPENIKLLKKDMDSVIEDQSKQ